MQSIYFRCPKLFKHFQGKLLWEMVNIISQPEGQFWRWNGVNPLGKQGQRLLDTFVCLLSTHKNYFSKCLQEILGKYAIKDRRFLISSFCDLEIKRPTGVQWVSFLHSLEKFKVFPSFKVNLKSDFLYRWKFLSV